MCGSLEISGSWANADEQIMAAVSKTAKAVTLRRVGRELVRVPASLAWRLFELIRLQP